ncbi:MAG: MgtC/SapB family protein [Peptococcaceae bacterium]|nr:MgtC/SapB family protein [Peptococcaceae bacterium]
MIQALDFLREMTVLGVAVRLVLAMVCGGLIGYNRERMRRPKGLAGFRTYMMVCVGAALTMLLSQYEYTMITESWAAVAGKVGIKTDVSRFGAQVINGIGFLGAGTIIVTKDDKIRGLTTAAGLWASACLGLAIGAGFFEGALLAVALIVAAMYLFSGIKLRLLSMSRVVSLYVEVDGLTDLGDVLIFLRRQGAHIMEMDIGGERKEGDPCRVELVVYLPAGATAAGMLACVSRLKNVNHVHET